jgi:hypothetical protein
MLKIILLIASLLNIPSFSYAIEVLKLKADSTYQEKPVGIYKSMGGFCSDNYGGKRTKAQEQQCAESAKKVAVVDEKTITFEAEKLKIEPTANQEKPVGIYKSMGGFCSDNYGGKRTKAQEQQCAESAKKVAEAYLENGFCTPDLQQKECTTPDGRVYKYDRSANQLERGLIKALDEKNNDKRTPSSSPQ